jgi:Flp pilus assembly protein TadD
VQLISDYRGAIEHGGRIDTPVLNPEIEPTVRTTVQARGTLCAIGAVALLVGLTVVAYWPTFRAGFIWDDVDYVTQNQTLRSVQGLREIWLDPQSTPQYYPLVHTTFWIEYRLWRAAPAGYHVTNVLLHAVSAILLWRLLLLLEIPGAFLAACVFAVHPVNVESVAWVTERKNVLSLVFYLSALIVYLRGADRRGMYALSLLLFACAMLSKTVACSLPAAIVLILWWKRGRVTRADLLRLAPMFVIGLAMGLMTAWLEKVKVGAEGKEWTLSASQRVLIAGRALWFYAGKIVWPAKLTFIYPRWQIDTGVWWQWLFPIAAVVLITALWLARGRIGRGPVVAALLFAGILAPALGFINLYPMRYSFVADHFQYMGAIVLIVAIVMVAARLKKKSDSSASVSFSLLGGAIVIVLGWLTFQQSKIYHDLPTLWLDTLAKNPDCWMAQNNMAAYLVERNERPDDAEKYARRSLELNPDNAEAHEALGLIYSHQGRFDDAAKEFTAGLRLKPRASRIHVDWGVMLARMDRTEEARSHFATAVELRPRNLDALFDLATSLNELGRPADAEKYYRRTLEIAPTHVKALTGLAMLMVVQERGEAVEPALKACEVTEWKQATLIGNLALALATAGRTAEARSMADRAIIAARAAGQTDVVVFLEEWRRALDAKR